jgi:hypothetical protein
MLKHLRSAARYFIFFALGFLVFYVLNALCTTVYYHIAKMIDPLPYYNAVTEREAYEGQMRAIALAAGILTVPILTLICVVYDNERYEYIISKTDGFYRIKDGARIYRQEYAIADTIASFTAPLPIALLSLIPFPAEPGRRIAQAEKLLDSFLSLVNAFSDSLGLAFGIILILLISLAARIPAAYLGLRRWRGLWLSDIGR